MTIEVEFWNLVMLPGVQTGIECQRDIEKRGHFDWGIAE